MECEQKRKRVLTTGAVVRPILSIEFNSSGQVDLIDMQSMSSKNFRWIMVFQDRLTKFCMFYLLTSKRASVEASQLLDIFLTLGAPAILQSDNGAEFTAQVISEVTQLWPELKLVRGKPRHPQSQGSVERANGDIKDMLTAWLQDNSTADWSFGIKFVQFSKNSAYSAAIKRSPYEALFGSKTKVGLTSSSLLSEVIERLQSEEDLLAAISTDAENAATDVEETVREGEVMAQPVQLTDEEPLSPPVLTPVQPGPDETLLDVPELSPAPSPLTQRQTLIQAHRQGARVSQGSQAEWMIKRRRLEMPSVKRGDTVAVSIPQVDRGRGDPRNILGLVLDHDHETDLYRIAVKAGVLKDRYSRNQFDSCPERLLTEEDINEEKSVSLREAVNHQSTCGGQGFKKCNCASMQCKSNRCACYKAKVLCNSRCHASLKCKNK